MFRDLLIEKLKKSNPAEFQKFIKVDWLRDLHVVVGLGCYVLGLLSFVDNGYWIPKAAFVTLAVVTFIRGGRLKEKSEKILNAVD